MSASVAKLETLIVSYSSKYIEELWYNGKSISSFKILKDLLGLKFVLNSNNNNDCQYTNTDIEYKLEYYGQK